MDRRRFLTMGAALVGGIALEQAIPFNRVWSFPKNIKPLNIEPILPEFVTMHDIYYCTSAGVFHVRAVGDTVLLTEKVSEDLSDYWKDRLHYAPPSQSRVVSPSWQYRFSTDMPALTDDRRG